MTGAEWRQRYADYQAAEAAHERARGQVEQLRARLTACMSDCERAALADGLALAGRRARLTGSKLARATEAFTQGRSVLETIWSAPDDI